MDDIACPRCKTTKYRNPSLKLLVNVCGHGLCENCVELLFVKGSGSCPQCGIALRRNNFRLQVFEDATVEKEVDIRRRILKDFNKKEDDFPSSSDYNDYLEEIETIIYNLANSIDIESTKRKIEQYKKENKVQILKNKGKLSKEEEELQELLEMEQHELEYRKQQIVEEEVENAKERVKKKEALIDELMFSDLPAGQILATHVSNSKTERQQKIRPLPPKRNKVMQFSTGIKLHHQEAFLPVPKVYDENFYVYREPSLELCGPIAPVFKILETGGYIFHVRSATEPEKAGGFISNYACHRALQEAFCGLYFSPEQS